MKFCKDCHWYLPSDQSTENVNFDKCYASKQCDPVTGRAKTEYCFILRQPSSACGPDGKDFTPKGEPDNYRDDFNRTISVEDHHE